MSFVDPGDVIWEAFPGASDGIAAQINREGGLVCEQHPWRSFEECEIEFDCAGPGMTRDQAIFEGLLNPDGTPI